MPLNPSHKLSGTGLGGRLNFVKLWSIYMTIMTSPELRDSGILIKDRTMGDIWLRDAIWPKTDRNTNEPIMDDYNNTHSVKLNLTKEQKELFASTPLIRHWWDSKGKPTTSPYLKKDGTPQTLGSCYIGDQAEFGSFIPSEDDLPDLDNMPSPVPTEEQTEAPTEEPADALLPV